MSQLKIGRYEIWGQLGEGGMGTVYLAYDPTLGREVALKVLQPQLYLQDPQFSMRFEREARTIATLEHGSIVSLYDYGADGEWLYIVMRLMEGGTLSERLEKGPLGLEETIAIVRRIGSALDKAHSRGIVHRDLKPGNILFDEEGDAYLSDFGIVKAEDSTGLKTGTGQTMGTPQYMSPEQLEGEEVDSRSDIYSLGVVLFEMLSGSRPYKGKSTARIIMMQLSAPIPSIVDANPRLAPGLEAVIQKALAKEPNERYATAGEMTEALMAVATEPQKKRRK
ncbi:MAG: serine/threonine protein kinase [Anaerolineaceae bacterium]|nr:MAG: serine/threonine protein kinase [Anaerolineaceae bacterium]